MRTLLLLLLALVPSLASAQFTAAQRNGIIKSAIDSAAWLKTGTPTVVGGTRLQFGGTVPAGTPCMRCSIYLDDDDLRALKLDPAAALFTGAFNRYGVLQVCGAPITPTGPSDTYTAPRWLRDLIDTCSTTPVLAPTTWPRAIVAHRTDAQAQSAATGFACACSTGASCTYQPPKLPDGTIPAPGPAPLGFTMAAGSWTGAGCRLKTCTELAGFSSWPPECPVQ